MAKQKVLFVCIHNSARSQMAEAFLNGIGGGRFEAESAGLEPGKLNPVVVEAMREVGIDLGKRSTKPVASMIERGPYFDYVVTVCDEDQRGTLPEISWHGSATALAVSRPVELHRNARGKASRHAAGARRDPRESRVLVCRVEGVFATIQRKPI